MRAIDAEGRVSAKGWERPERDLLGVHVLFLSQHDLPDADARAREFLSLVPIVALTRGWRGLTLLTRDGVHDVPSLPRPEKDPTGAGDVFAAAFLVRYQETSDPLEAAAFAACAASCAVEGVGTTTLGDRAEVMRRMELRQHDDRGRGVGGVTGGSRDAPSSPADVCRSVACPLPADRLTARA